MMCAVSYLFSILHQFLLTSLSPPKSKFSLTPQSTINMMFFDVLPFLLLVAVPVAVAQLVMHEYNSLQLDFDLSLAGPAYS